MGLRWPTGVYSSPRGPGLPQGQAGPSPSPSVRWPWSPTHDRATLAWVGVQTVCGMPVVQQGPRAEPGRRRGGEAASGVRSGPAGFFGSWLEG